MITVKVETTIRAPIEKCFDLARDLNVHTETTRSTKERVVEGPPGGMMALGDVVTFEAVHFGIRQRLTARIVDYDRPKLFVDEMVKGAFRRLKHEHRFDEADGVTTMTDVVELAAPLGPLGWIAERLFLAAYMRVFLARRGDSLREILERRPS